MREWLSIIIVLLILGIVLDGVRRMRAHRKTSLRLSKGMSNDDENEVLREITSGDFPSGGPRVVAYRDSKDTATVTRSARENYTASRQTKGSPVRIQEPDREGYNKDSERSEINTVEPDFSDGPSLGDFNNLDDDAIASERDGQFNASDERETEVDIVESPSPYISPSNHKSGRVTETQSTSTAKPEPKAHAHSYSKPEQSQSPELSEETDFDVEETSEDEEGMSETGEEFTAPDMVLVINIMARKGEVFGGEALLDALVDNGLRYGDMDIFHRHESSDGKGKILFSAANLVMPGTFELSEMDHFTTPGITMFLSLPISSDSLTAYNLMAEAALGIANALNGELKDEQRSVMTRQTIEHDRQRVIEYERKRRLERAES